jgi:hypothetical protein
MTGPCVEQTCHGRPSPFQVAMARMQNDPPCRAGDRRPFPCRAGDRLGHARRRCSLRGRARTRSSNASHCYAARRSPLRGKAGLASQGNYGPDREVDDSLGGPTAGAADQPERTTRAASPRPHPNVTRRVTVTSDMTGSEPGRRRSVGTYRRNRPLNARGRARVTATIHSLQL